MTIYGYHFLLDGVLLLILPFLLSDWSVWCWLANPIFLVGVRFVAADRPKAAAWLGGVATALAATAFGYSGQDAGLLGLYNIRGLLPGYYIWLGSMVFLTSCGIALLSRQHRNRERVFYRE
jgi:hypothetical protein